MFRLNKDLEYALISLIEMCRSDVLLSTRVLAEQYSIPYKLLGRVLQKLSGEGILHAMKGPRGGYKLAVLPDDIRLGRVIRAVHGDNKIADCLTERGSCAQEGCGCTIKPIVQIFQDRWVNFVENTTLSELVHPGGRFERKESS